MKCPVCTDTPLVMAERQGVEIDYCPACRGIWLDRGELDKLLDRSSAAAPQHAAQARHMGTASTQPPADGDGYHGYGERDAYKRKKSWLHDIFD